MKSGEEIQVRFPRVKNGNHCPFCNETEVDYKHSQYACGYHGRWVNDYVAYVGGVCKNFNKPPPEPPPVFTGFDLLSGIMEKPEIKSQVTTYQYDLNAIKTLFANHLEVPVEQVSLRFTEREIGDDRFGPTHSEVNGVEVSVKTK